MNTHFVQRRSVIALLLVVIVGLAWTTGCSTTVQEQQQGQSVTGPPPEGSPWAEVGRVYLDDVRVPNELEYDVEDSILYETPKFKAGVLRFSKWWLDTPSLIDFFMVNMVKDKWTFVNSFKGKEAYLSFAKPEKTCVIRITENWLGTVKVSIAVGPLGEKPPAGPAVTK
jgi:hypothetical protein